MNHIEALCLATKVWAAVWKIAPNSKSGAIAYLKRRGSIPTRARWAFHCPLCEYTLEQADINDPGRDEDWGSSADEGMVGSDCRKYCPARNHWDGFDEPDWPDEPTCCRDGSQFRNWDRAVMAYLGAEVLANRDRAMKKVTSAAEAMFRTMLKAYVAELKEVRK